MADAGPDREAVQRRVVSLSRMMYVHRGGVELQAVHDDGTVEVRYRGMCAGCSYRPVCSETAVRPAILDLDGVRVVEIQGSRINEENRRALVESLTSRLEPPPASAPPAARTHDPRAMPAQP